MHKKRILKRGWYAVFICAALIALAACQRAPTDESVPAEALIPTPTTVPTPAPTALPTPAPTAHSSPEMVMLGMLEAAFAGDYVAFTELLAFPTPFNLAKMDEMVTNCKDESATEVPFDVEYERVDLAVGFLGSLAGRYTVFMERFEGEWYISEIQGTSPECPY